MQDHPLHQAREIRAHRVSRPRRSTRTIDAPVPECQRHPTHSRALERNRPMLHAFWFNFIHHLFNPQVRGC